MSNPEDQKQACCDTTQASAPAPDTTATVRAAWETYRGACFIRPGPALIWVWSASHDFDLAPAGLHLGQLPDARLELGTHAMALLFPHPPNPELREWHLVPLPRLTTRTLAAIQPAAAADLAQRVQELVAEQQAAQAQLSQLVNQANLWRLLPGSADGTVQ